MRIPFPSNLAADGVARVWRGLRQGDQRGLLLGAAMLAVSWLRESRGPERTLIKRIVLPAGESVVIRNGPGEPLHLDLE
jgi:hypothetical protein